VNVTVFVELAPALATTPDPALWTVRFWAREDTLDPTLEVAVSVTA
jgi:hypothetical protein